MTTTAEPPDIYRINVTGSSQSLSNSASTGPIEVSNVPPSNSITPNTGAGSTQTFAIQMRDRIDIAGMNLLIAIAGGPERLLDVLRRHRGLSRR